MLRKTFIMLMAVALAVSFGRLGALNARAQPPAQDNTPTAEPEGEHGSGERIDPGDAAIRIISPTDGAVVNENSVLVRVETTNFPLGDDKHFHLYVDGNEQGMSQGTSDSIMAVDLQRGENVFEVVLSNEQHQELDASDTITIRYEAAQPSGSTTTIPPATEDSTALIIGIVVAVLVVGGVGFVVARRR